MHVPNLDHSTLAFPPHTAILNQPPCASTAPIAILVAVVLALILLLFWKLPHRSESGSPVSGLNRAVLTVVSNSPDFVKNRVTGGVGVVLMPGTHHAFPVVRSVLPGSPAQLASLLPGDQITEINGWSTSNQLLAPVVDAMHGVTGGSVKLEIQRPGSTNLTLIIHRTSWNSLGVSTSPRFQLHFCSQIPPTVPTARTLSSYFLLSFAVGLLSVLAAVGLLFSCWLALTAGLAVTR